MCGIVGYIDTQGQRVSGRLIVEAIHSQRERGNGLGAGFAGYGIHPEHADEYALYIMYEKGKYSTPPRPHPRVAEVEDWLALRMRISHTEEVPLAPDRQQLVVVDGPYFKRYFCRPLETEFTLGRPQDEAMKNFVLQINAMDGVFVLSCGKNMGVFKGIGYPEDIAQLFCLERYEAWMWVAHSRFPTNTPGRWSGSHPFTMLGTAVVHNGEVTSYGTNVRWLEQHGYHCTMGTDTEVIAYIFDKLRRDGLGVEQVCCVMAPPLWSEIDRTGNDRMRQLRQFYGGAVVNGPFAIIISDEQGAIALCDRDKLRPLIVAQNGSQWVISSEECSFGPIWADQKPDKIIRPDGGQPVIIRKEIV